MRWLGRRVESHAELASTNDRAMELLDREGRDAHGTVVLARSQPSGRGRHGRKWHGAEGASLLFSVAIWNDPLPRGFALLPLAGALAVAEVLESSEALAVRVRWPNDVLAGERKIAGVLSEARWRGNLPGGAVIGIGLNLLQRENDFPKEIRDTAVSVLGASGRAPRAESFGALLLSRLEARIDEAFASPRRTLDRMASLWSHRLGEGLRLLKDGEVLAGTFAGVGGEGELLLDRGGVAERHRAGDVLRVLRGEGGP